MNKKLFRITAMYGQFVAVASSKEEVYKIYHPEDPDLAEYYSYYRVEMEDIEEVEGYKVHGPTAIIGGYSE